MPSLTGRWICSLQQLLALASTAILRPKSRGTRDHTLLSVSGFPQPGGPDPHIYIRQGQGGPVIPTDPGVPFHRLLQL
jgi:hypothetical protein